jgi:hypothetical protein
MSKSVLQITTHLPSIPKWLKINNNITIPLPLKNAKELAAKLLEVKEDMEIEFHIETGKEPSVEIRYDLKKDPE